jgi:hypothetical protein
VALLAVFLVYATALGDADPASDVLLGENVFYPYDPAVTAKLQAELNGIVAAAHRAHLPLKVALIATPIDLGAVPSFFGKPKEYAAFLDQEITFGGPRVPLLVVMPSGYGDAGLSPAASAVVAGLGRPKPASNGLAQAAIAAVRKIKAAAGHRLGRPVASRSGAGGGAPVVLLAILGGVCLAGASGIIWRRRAARPSARGRRAGPRR